MPALKPLQVISKSLQRHTLLREPLNGFAAALAAMRAAMAAANEEAVKNLVRHFLRATFYASRYVNVPQGNIDLAIHEEPTAASPIAVIENGVSRFLQVPLRIEMGY